MEELDRSGRSGMVYANVKKLTRKSSTAGRSTSIKDRDGKLITEPDKIRERWKEYIEQLYDKAGKTRGGRNPSGTRSYRSCKGSALLTSEIIEAIKDMKKNKAVGVDDIPAEFLRALGEEGTKELVEICARKCTMRVFGPKTLQ